MTIAAAVGATCRIAGPLCGASSAWIAMAAASMRARSKVSGHSSPTTRR